MVEYSTLRSYCTANGAGVQQYIPTVPCTRREKHEPLKSQRWADGTPFNTSHLQNQNKKQATQNQQLFCHSSKRVETRKKQIYYSWT